MKPCFLLAINYGLWDGGTISIEQGPSLEYPNIVKLKATSIDWIQRVLFGGNAIVKYVEKIKLE